MQTLTKIIFVAILFSFVIHPNDLYAKKNKGFKYDDIVLELQAKGSKSVVFATHDLRPYIMDGTRMPDFAGYLRNAVGMAYPTSTASKLPLTDVMSQVFRNSFWSNGFNAEVITTNYIQTSNDVIENCKKEGADLFVILTLEEWQSDGYGGNADIKYNITMRVYEGNGTLLAEKKVYAEKENMGITKKNAWGFLKEETRKFFKSKMEEIFNSEEFLNAFN